MLQTDCEEEHGNRAWQEAAAQCSWGGGCPQPTKAMLRSELVGVCVTCERKKPRVIPKCIWSLSINPLTLAHSLSSCSFCKRNVRWKRIIIMEFFSSWPKGLPCEKDAHELFVLRKMNGCCCFYCIFICKLSFTSIRPLLNFRVFFAYSNLQHVFFALCKKKKKKPTKLYIIFHGRSFASIMSQGRKVLCKQPCEKRIC